jgi:hypothetical protein
MKGKEYDIYFILPVWCLSLTGHRENQHGTRPLQPIARLGTTGAETAAATEELTVTSGAAAGAGAGAETGSKESACRAAELLSGTIEASYSQVCCFI